MVDWSGDWTTPWGLASQMICWSENASEAAQRTPREALLCSESEAAATNVFYSVRKRSGSNKCFFLCESEAAATKRPVGTEINPSFCRGVVLCLNRQLDFIEHNSFQQHEEPMTLQTVIGFFCSLYKIMDRLVLT